MVDVWFVCVHQWSEDYVPSQALQLGASMVELNRLAVNCHQLLQALVKVAVMSSFEAKVI